MLHKSVLFSMWGRNKTVNFIETMLDAGYLMLDILEFTRSKSQKHPVSRIKDPGSRNIANGFHRNIFSPRKHYMQLKDYFSSTEIVWSALRGKRPWIEKIMSSTGCLVRWFL
jgi:hypothetical protein